MKLGLLFFLWSLTASALTCPRFLAGWRDAYPALFGKVPRVKVALAQTSTTVADFDYNVRVIRRFLEQAAKEGAEAIVFPELVVSSYPPRDWLERRDFRAANQKALRAVQRAIAETKDAPSIVVVGSLTENPGSTGKPLQNSALIFFHGVLVHSQAKTLLPEYDVFDERRYFEPATASKLWKARFGKVGLAVCEDAWKLVAVLERLLYSPDPALRLRGSDLIFHLNASPYEMTKDPGRSDVFGGFARRANAAVISVNQVGLQDDILFDGRSAVHGANGERLFSLPPFEEALGIVELELGKQTRLLSGSYRAWNSTRYGWSDRLTHTPKLTEYQVLRRGLVLAIREYFAKVGYERAVLGLSGGIDSAVIAGLLVEALGADNVIAVSLPHDDFSSDGSVVHAEAIAKFLGIKKHYKLGIKGATNAVHDSGLQEIFDDLSRTHHWKSAEDDTTADNVQATLRYLMLRAVANKYDGLVMGTSNKTERAVGQSTTDADGSGAYAPIGDLWKTQVYELGRELNSDGRKIPDEVFAKAASSELPSGFSDEDKFGKFTVLDPVLRAYVEELLGEDEIVARGNEAAYVKRILGILRTNEFKRQRAPLSPKVSPKAFGSGRRIPVTSFFREVR